MNYDDMSTERIQAAITGQEETIKRATYFRAQPGVGNSTYINYTRTITQAEERIAEYRAELARR
jgi:hypothetical protein